MKKSFTLSLLVSFLFTACSAAQDKPPLKWGGDKNGGAPFIFEDSTGKLVGFEVELAEYLAGELGRTPVFVQNQWDNIPEQLKRPNLGRADDIDIAMNGFEYLPDRHAETPTSVPYYVYTFRLIANKQSDIRSWEGLKGADPKLKVGVLRGTASQKYLEGRFGDTIELVPSETVTEQLEILSTFKNNRLDATVQDSPAAAYYVLDGRYPELKVVDEPVGTGYYCILTRPKDDELREKINAAIRKAIQNGKLKTLYQKYGLWDANQQRLQYLAGQPWPEVTEELKVEEGQAKPAVTISWTVVFPKLLKAALNTILLAVSAFPLAMFLGLVVAMMRVYGPWPLRFLGGLYVEVIRGTPLLLQLFVIFYLLPILGEQIGWPWLTKQLNFSPFMAGILGLAINYSASEAENYRAGLQAIPKGQSEAALALGLSPWSVLRHIVVPQAFRVVIPPVTNDFIAMFKDTAVCSTVLIIELTGLYYQYKTYPGVVVPLALTVGGLYLLMSYPLSLLARRLEKTLATGREGGRA